MAVEHRAAFRPRTLILLGFAYLGYCSLPQVREVLINFYNSRDPVIACFALLLLLIPFIFGISWLLFTSGEVMRCDSRELLFARRRTLGRWHRFRFQATQVQGLQQAFRGNAKRRNFTVLTFEVDGKRYDMLEDITKADSEQILNACKEMGLDAVYVVQVGEAMLRDIETRGWFVNPLRRDQDREP